MPRKPTGNPRGRPPGTGKLGEQTRLTVRIPTLLYDRLEAFAAGRHFHRGTPQLAGCVRDALAEYLDRQSKRQTQNTHSPVVEDWEEKRQPENEAQAPNHTAQNKRQTKKDTRPVERSSHATRTTTRQTRNTHADPTPRRVEAEETKRQTKKTALEYDHTRYRLGTLCDRGHDFQGSGQSLLRQHNGYCRDCDNEDKRTRRQVQRPPQVAAAQERKAAILGMIRGWQQEEGLGPQAIAERLNAEQVPTLRGSGAWSRGTVHKLLYQAQPA